MNANFICPRAICRKDFKRYSIEIKSIVSLEKAEKVVKEPKKPINNKGLNICSNFGSNELN